MKWIPFVLLAACGLPPESQQRIADCSALYMACVEESSTMAEYTECRAKVDERCLDES